MEIEDIASQQPEASSDKIETSKYDYVVVEFGLKKGARPTATTAAEVVTSRWILGTYTHWPKCSSSKFVSLVRNHCEPKTDVKKWEEHPIARIVGRSGDYDKAQKLLEDSEFQSEDDAEERPASSSRPRRNTRRALPSEKVPTLLGQRDTSSDDDIDKSNDQPFIPPMKEIDIAGIGPSALTMCISSNENTVEDHAPTHNESQLDVNMPSKNQSSDEQDYCDSSRPQRNTRRSLPFEDGSDVNMSEDEPSKSLMNVTNKAGTGPSALTLSVSSNENTVDEDHAPAQNESQFDDYVPSQKQSSDEDDDDISFYGEPITGQGEPNDGGEGIGPQAFVKHSRSTCSLCDECAANLATIATCRDDKLNLPSKKDIELYQSLPCNSMKQLLEVENHLENSNSMNFLATKLHACKHVNLAKFVNNCLRKLMTDKVGMHFNITGSSEKDGDKDSFLDKNFTALIMNAVVNNPPSEFSTSPEATIDAVRVRINNWFKNAKKRYTSATKTSRSNSVLSSASERGFETKRPKQSNHGPETRTPPGKTTTSKGFSPVVDNRTYDSHSRRHLVMESPRSSRHTANLTPERPWRSPSGQSRGRNQYYHRQSPYVSPSRPPHHGPMDWPPHGGYFSSPYSWANQGSSNSRFAFDSTRRMTHSSPSSHPHVPRRPQF